MLRILFLMMVVFSPAHVMAQAAESLPRVLILGDSVFTQYVSDAAKTLKGKVDVVVAATKPGEVRNLDEALKNLDAILGEKEWDLIHFNFGLVELVYRAPNMKTFRVMAKDAGGVRATSAQAYEEKLDALVKRLHKTGAKLIWASTTPIRSSRDGIFDVGSEIEFNAVAAKVMAGHKVSVNDMHDYALQRMDMKRPEQADPFFFDRKPLHPPVVAAILSGLNLPPLPAEAPEQTK